MKLAAFRLGLTLLGPPPDREEEWAVAGHGEQFVRVALHLAYRAQALGGAQVIENVIAGANSLGYRSAPWQVFARALGGEPRRLARASVEEVKRLPPPRAFARLFRPNLQGD
jgi:hypothetical protein